MSTLLKIDVSPRGDYSISRKLGNHFATEWQSNHVDGKIIIRDLATTKIPYVDLPWIAGAFSAELSHLARPTQKRRTAPSRQRSCACCTHGKLLCNFRNTLHRSVRGHILSQPYICPPPSNERRSGDHCKRNT